ncbi:MAG: hypothetical protein ACPGU1_10560 [Myxococcota bacterium]
MNARPLLFALSLFLLPSAGACVDVGTDPGPEPTVPDIEEPTVEGCEEAEQQTYRCRDNEEEVQICKEAAVGEFVWDTIDFCEEDQGCFASPLNAYPACMSKFDCYSVVYELISCDSAPQLGAYDRIECRNGVERLALDDSYQDLYTCYYDFNCHETKNPTDCVMERCSDLLLACVEGEAGPPRAGSEASSPEPSIPDEGGADVSEETEDPGVGADASNDESVDAVSAENPPGALEVPEGCEVDFITCVSGCVPTCLADCDSSTEGPVTDYAHGLCQQECPSSCVETCAAEEDHMGPMELLGMGNCATQCANVSGMSIQACLLQQCPQAVAPCFQGTFGSSEVCSETVECLFQSVSAEPVTSTLECAAEATQDTLDQAVAVLACVSEATRAGEPCAWDASSLPWADHVAAEAACFAEACGPELYSCPSDLFGN